MCVSDIAQYSSLDNTIRQNPFHPFIDLLFSPDSRLSILVVTEGFSGVANSFEVQLVPPREVTEDERESLTAWLAVSRRISSRLALR